MLKPYIVNEAPNPKLIWLQAKLMIDLSVSFDTELRQL